MSLFLNNTSHGHSLHGCDCGIGNNDADVARGSTVFVHRRDYPDSARTCCGRVRGMGHPRGASLLPFRSSKIGRKIQECAKVAMAVLMGLSFAMPALADTYAWDSFTGYATGGSSIPTFQKPGTSCATGYPYGLGHGPYTNSNFTWYQTDIDLTLHSIDLWPLLSTGNHLISAASSVAMQIGVTDLSDPGLATTNYYGTVFGGTNYNTSRRFEPIAPEIFGYQRLLSGRTYLFTARRDPGVPWYTSSTDYIVADFLHVNNNNTTSNTILNEWVYNFSDDLESTPCAIPQDDASHAVYGTIKLGLNGTAQDNSSNPVEIPTSTYDGTFSGGTGSISFGTTTANIADGIYSAKFDSMFGAATGTFPLCLVSPWIAFLDIIQGFTQLPQSSGSIIVSQPFGAGTSTFSLGAASGTFAAIGLVNITNLLFPFLQGLAWLTFGVIVFKNLFMKSNDDEAL